MENIDPVSLYSDHDKEILKISVLTDNHPGARTPAYA